MAAPSLCSSWAARVRALPLLGVIICFASSGLFGLCNVIVKSVDTVDPFTIAFYRFLGIALPAYSVLLYRGEDPSPRGKRVLLVVRSLMGASNLIIHFYGLKHMPMADANMLSAASPIWVVLLGRVFLKEKLGLVDVLNVVITLGGILLIIRPPFIFGHDPSFVLDSQYYIAAVILFAGSFVQAGVYIILRLLKNIHYSVTLTNFGTIGALESAVFMGTLGQSCVPACGYPRLMMVAVGLLSFLAQILLTVSLQLEEAGKISIMRKAGDILFAFLFQILIFHDLPGVWSVLGALLVSSAVFINGTTKIVGNLPDDHIVKTKYLRLCYGPAEREGESQD